MNDGKVVVDNQKFVSVDGVRVCRVVGNGRLQFCDKDKRRSSMRGTRYVEISIVELRKVIDAAAPPPSPSDSGG